MGHVRGLDNGARLSYSLTMTTTNPEAWDEMVVAKAVHLTAKHGAREAARQAFTLSRWHSARSLERKFWNEVHASIVDANGLAATEA